VTSDKPLLGDDTTNVINNDDASTSPSESSLVVDSVVDNPVTARTDDDDLTETVAKTTRSTSPGASPVATEAPTRSDLAQHGTISVNDSSVEVNDTLRSGSVHGHPPTHHGPWGNVPWPSDGYWGPPAGPWNWGGSQQAGINPAGAGGQWGNHPWGSSAPYWNNTGNFWTNGHFWGPNQPPNAGPWINGPWGGQGSAGNPSTTVMGTGTGSFGGNRPGINNNQVPFFCYYFLFYFYYYVR
jgi:hypothetical protein